MVHHGSTCILLPLLRLTSPTKGSPSTMSNLGKILHGGQRMAKVLYSGEQICLHVLLKASTLWVGCKNVTDRRICDSKYPNVTWVASSGRGHWGTCPPGSLRMHANFAAVQTMAVLIFLPSSVSSKLDRRSPVTVAEKTSAIFVFADLTPWLSLLDDFVTTNFGTRAPHARATQRLFYSPLVWGEVKGFGEAERPLEEGPGRASAPPHEFFFDFWSPNSDFWCTVRGYFYGSVCFWRRQPLHDSIMSVTSVIAGSWTEHALVDNSERMSCIYRPVTRSLSEIVLHNLLTFFGGEKTFGEYSPIHA